MCNCEILKCFFCFFDAGEQTKRSVTTASVMSRRFQSCWPQHHYSITMVAATSATERAAVSRQDEELTELLTKLYTIQEDIGAKPATTDEEKKAKAANVAVMGKGKKAAAKGSRFLELKSTVVDRLKTIHNLLKETKEKEAAGYGGDNAKEIIKLQAEVREHIRQAGDEWNEMDAIYKKEARKKKSKFTPEELEVQSELVRRLSVEIEKMKEAQMRGYSKNRDAGAAVSLNTKALYADAGAWVVPYACFYCGECLLCANNLLIRFFMFMSGRSGTGGSKSASWGGTGGGVAVTQDQQQQILQLEERDADFDRQLDEIGEGIQDLAEIAALQGEEVQRQSVMLENVNNKMDRVNERMVSVNTKMKDTLEEVGRASDKLCVDIMCIVLAIGFGSVIYKFVAA